jgi:hypothetical protein
MPRLVADLRIYVLNAKVDETFQPLMDKVEKISQEVDKLKH